MIQDTITKIEARLQQTDAVDAQGRKELLELLGRLKTEVLELSKTHAAQAQRIAGLTDASARAVTGEEQNPEALRGALEDLTSSVEGFEGSHPRLVEVVNRLATTLSSLGI
jgi:hypothetical protein